MSVLDRHRYLILSALIVAMMISYASNELWSPDFWEHTAVVRELAAHPTHPQHPILARPEPHALYSPYALGLAEIVRLTGASPASVRVVFGVLNVALWLAALKALVDLVTRQKHAAFYTVLFTLALWGFAPWDTSGFLHLNTLGQVMSYPATFVTALVFAIFTLFVRIVGGGRLVWLVALVPLMTLAVLSHPVSGISMYTGLGALAIGFSGDRMVRTMLALAACCALSLALACAWPLYSLPAVLFANTSLYSAPEALLFPGVAGLLVRTFPALPGLAALAGRARANRRDFLLWMFLGTCAVYMFGAATSKYIFCRVMPFLIFPLHLAWACWTDRAEQRARATGAVGRDRLAWAAALALLLVSSVNVLPGALSALPVYQSSARQYAFLERYTRPYDVVLSDLNTSLKIPAFGVKVVAYPHVLPFIQDREDRQRDLLRFLEADTPAEERDAILARYHVRYVLLNKVELKVWPQLLKALSAGGKLVYANGDLMLVRVGKKR
ncbi:MAG TPA: hypothetical protein VHA11_02305 [Bryobacteraceae bacterium]|nr:hypothetical protein [Bryobacteraceae bacterium]